MHEYQVQQRFLDLILKAGLVLPEDEPPIVAVNANSGNPHYEPTRTQSSPIRRGDLILFDFWGALLAPSSIYADYTWVAFAGTRDEIPTHQRNVFEIVRSARDSAIAFMRAQLAAGERVEGRMVDDVARGIIEKAGYGKYFVIVLVTALVPFCMAMGPKKIRNLRRRFLCRLFNGEAYLIFLWP